MRVDVPMTFSFDDKSSAPKPPLRAVLDKVAVSMARQASTKVRVARSPGRRHAAPRCAATCRVRGVIGLRVVVLAPTQSTQSVACVPGPVAIDKLDDKNLPPPSRRAALGNRGCKNGAPSAR